MALAAFVDSVCAVDDARSPGEDIAARRERLGMKIKDLAAEAGVDRGWLGQIERGEVKGGGVTVGKILRALERLEMETGMDDAASMSAVSDPGDDLVEFTIEGNFGVRAVVKGPVRDMQELKEAVARLVREMKGDADA